MIFESNNSSVDSCSIEIAQACGYVCVVVFSVLLLTILTVLYLLWYSLVIVRHPQLYGGKGGLKEYLVTHCPVLSQPYRPTVWAWHYHFQTTLRHFSSQGTPVVYNRQIVDLADGGVIALDWAREGTGTKPVLLIIPGFTGDSTQDYIYHIVHDGLLSGYQCVVFNQRGMGDIMITSPRLFTFSNVEDLEVVLDKINACCPEAQIVGVAVSLGGITLTHYLHATGRESKLSASVIFSMAWNVRATSYCFEKLSNRILYTKYILNKLKTIVRKNSEMLKQHPKVDLERILQARTFDEFDRELTVPTHNLSSTDESKTRGDSDHRLSGVQVPYLAVTSKDDPFVPLHSIPITEFEANPNTLLLLTRHGGHFGFLEGVFPRGHSWMDKVVCQFLTAMKERDI